jgi:hypothetical protein
LSFEADERGAKKRDYWFTVLLTDPIATPLAGFLAKRRWLTPNQVTTLSLIAGLSVGVFFATAQRWGFIVGGIMFYVAFILDCTDGKLARATGITSAKGQALDALADAGRRASALLGFGVAFWRDSRVEPPCEPSEPWSELSQLDSCPPISDWPWALMIVLLYAVLAYYFLEISGADRGYAADGVLGRWSAALAKRRLLPTPGMPDVQAVVFVLGPITGLVISGLFIGIAMVSVAILLTVIRRLR